MLRYYAFPKIQEFSGSPTFQQECAPAQYPISARQYLDRKFGDNWKGRGPPLSPDLTPLDLFLYGHVKDDVYSVPIEPLSHLKHRIRQAIRRIDQSVLAKVWKNPKMRLNHVVPQGGGHTEQLVI